jgi:hypothetical protein
MFDDFRDQVEETDFEAEEPEPALAGYMNMAPEKPQYFLGMTPVQRFIISVELLFMVCISGALILIVLGRIQLPF